MPSGRRLSGHTTQFKLSSNLNALVNLYLEHAEGHKAQGVKLKVRDKRPGYCDACGITLKEDEIVTHLV
ncbi:MAG: hypothetical protein WBF33_10845 [Candidatus Nitrosopolaris sp.]|jgi:hypothetical protein